MMVETVVYFGCAALASDVAAGRAWLLDDLSTAPDGGTTGSLFLLLKP